MGKKIPRIYENVSPIFEDYIKFFYTYKMKIKRTSKYYALINLVLSRRTLIVEVIRMSSITFIFVHILNDFHILVRKSKIKYIEV